ncbi:MAG: DUF6580 family putative transport protein [Pseudomonadota bacterium]
MIKVSETQTRVLALAAVILFAAAYRVLPHPPNIAPVAAMALFAGAHFRDWRLALAAPLSVMLLSDAILGLHATLIYVYAGMALTVGIGLFLRRRLNTGTLVLASLSSSGLFYLITNFGSWLGNPMYSQDAAGLLTAYAAGIPFLQYSTIGDLAFTAVFFGGYALARQTTHATA